MNLKNFVSKIVSVISSVFIIKLQGCDLDNILIDKKSHENNLIYDISHTTLIDSKPLRIRFDEIDGL